MTDIFDFNIGLYNFCILEKKNSFLCVESESANKNVLSRQVYEKWG